MKPQELRVGNLVYVPGLFEPSALVEPVEFIYSNGEIGTKSTEAHASYYRPIELNEDWILKFGFEKTTPDGWMCLNICNDWTFLYWHKGVLELSVNRHSVVLKHIESVHELQNLIFALTGEELTIKEQP
ncbi:MULTISPECIES: hypothetical protein [unclassified Chryseobacterium]|uniref:hypothetical protein n=1 Tax=unclassified Chryseobacterium TaxID=2593645 RepID=UPI002853178D|nr:hypothetical protein [Chryseobacterium sp. CFS7]MDR4892255.1 hypothetical protein [Chryseobacterium sp. CFS7]